MFSQKGMMPIMLILSFSSAAAFMAVSTVSAPALSTFMVSMKPVGLRLMPPESNVMPFAYKRYFLAARRIAVILSHNHARTGGRAAADCKYHFHAHFLQFLFAKDGYFHPCLPAYFPAYLFHFSGIHQRRAIVNPFLDKIGVPAHYRSPFHDVFALFRLS